MDKRASKKRPRGKSRQKAPLRIGLTGGIASGKSTVAEMFAELDVPVIDTDIIAREVVEPGQPALAEIRERFGATVLDAAGRLDRAAMRKIVFAEPDKRRELEEILHPRIRRETERQALAKGGEYQLIVVPLLVESPMRDSMDRVLVVDVPEPVQLARLLARDAENAAQAEAMIAAQASRAARLAIADDIISNDGSLESTRRQVQRLDRQYRKLAAPQKR
ncbi:MAG: dephospho-CoA kinase [Woeseia sp.]